MCHAPFITVVTRLADENASFGADGSGLAALPHPTWDRESRITQTGMIFFF